MIHLHLLFTDYSQCSLALFLPSSDFMAVISSHASLQTPGKSLHLIDNCGSLPLLLRVCSGDITPHNPQARLTVNGKNKDTVLKVNKTSLPTSSA